MDESDWVLVEAALKAGRYNLLLGAGVSLDGHSQDGRGLPSIGLLTKELAEEMPGVRAGSSLNRLYRSIKQAGKVESLITTRFSNTRSGPTLQKLCEFRWRRIFTLNVDDALEHAYATNPNKAQNPLVINYSDPFSESRDPTEVPVVHLHGYAKRSNDGFVFDIK